MTQKIGLVLLIVAVVAAVPMAAADNSGAISGYVRDARGIPQMGAMVEVFTSASSSAVVVFTDPRGFFAARNVLPGIYHLKISLPSFLPYMQENVTIRAGASLVVNATLNTLFEALQFLPAKGRAADQGDDWKWTLRSAGNRSVLRVLDGEPVVMASGEPGHEKALKGRVTFLAGADEGFGSASESTRFSVERSLFTSGTVSVRGDLAYGPDGSPASVVRAGYSHQLPDGSKAEISVTARRFLAPGLGSRDATFQAMQFSVADTFSVAEFAEFTVGSELQTVQFMGHASALRPFGTLDVHLSPNTVLEYRYATSKPNTRSEKGYDSAPADFSESLPRVSLANWSAEIERATHQEISLSRRYRDTKVQLAWYSDRIVHPALEGVGAPDLTSGNFLPDLFSGTFTVGGPRLEASGVRAVLQRKFSQEMTATLGYAYGEVLDREGQMLPGELGLLVRPRHAVMTKVSGNLPHCGTKWIASYKWSSGRAVTQVDAFNTSASQSDPYLNLFVRQPLPTPGFMPARMEMMMEIRNLLAQGYVPVVGQDGRTLYLVQSARAVRGGFAFTF